MRGILIGLMLMTLASCSSHDAPDPSSGGENSAVQPPIQSQPVDEPNHDGHPDLTTPPSGTIAEPAKQQRPSRAPASSPEHGDVGYDFGEGDFGEGDYGEGDKAAAPDRTAQGGMAEDGVAGSTIVDMTTDGDLDGSDQATGNQQDPIEPDIAGAPDVTDELDIVALGPAPNRVLKNSRAFQFGEVMPLKGFAGFGIIASKIQPEDEDEIFKAYEMICRAWIGSFQSVAKTSGVGGDVSDQVVTIWPISDQTTWQSLTALDEQLGRSGGDAARRMAVTTQMCKRAAGAIDMTAGQVSIDTAINAFENSGVPRQDASSWFQGEGPFLLAWYPREHFAAQSTPVFCADLSGISHVNHVATIFDGWMRFIKSHPQNTPQFGGCMKRSWVFTIRLFLDREGQRWARFVKSGVAELFGLGG